jgi:hypothetical protein
MRTSSTPIRTLVALVVLTLGLWGALTARPAPAGAAVKTGVDKLVLTWVDGGAQLQVDGYAYRPRAVVDVRLGDRPLQQARSDENGRVQLTVPQELVAAGQSGASIIVAGRSVSGAARVLISAVPPRAAVRGPVDALPWSIGGLAVAVLALGALHRLLTRRTPAAAAPAGYLSRHRAARNRTAPERSPRSPQVSPAW